MLILNLQENNNKKITCVISSSTFLKRCAVFLFEIIVKSFIKDVFIDLLLCLQHVGVSIKSGVRYGLLSHSMSVKTQIRFRG